MTGTLPALATNKSQHPLYKGCIFMHNCAGASRTCSGRDFPLYHILPILSIGKINKIINLQSPGIVHFDDLTNRPSCDTIRVSRGEPGSGESNRYGLETDTMNEVKTNSQSQGEGAVCATSSSGAGTSTLRQASSADNQKSPEFFEKTS